MPIDVDVVPKSIHTTEFRENTRGLWLGLLAGPLIYALYFTAGYLLAEAACRTSFLNATVNSFSALLVVVEGVTILAGLMTLAAAGYGYRLWRRHQDEQEHAGGALPFMAFGGLLLSLLFMVMIVVTGVAVAFINLCEWV
ncbi:MAG: hypothetical protein R3C14_47715 [Caldilineaceae bacterium]